MSAACPPGHAECGRQFVGMGKADRGVTEGFHFKKVALGQNKKRARNKGDQLEVNLTENEAMRVAKGVKESKFGDA